VIIVEHKPPEPVFGQILLSGDEQSGTDALQLSGDMTDGDDCEKHYEVL
jgi:hypothetical protein